MKMKKVKVVYFDNGSSTYDVDYPIAYCEKIRENENALVFDDKRVAEVYVDDKLVMEYQGTSLELVQPKTNKSMENKDMPFWVMDHTGGNIEITYS
jgi:hypothetical protein|tara:strand:- start:686 stop:973 length:288 start_codon:yes stop_codon:yes gene_type:complete